MRRSFIVRVIVRRRSIQRAMQYGGDLPALFRERREFFGQDGLHAVGKSAVGIVVNFDEQAIRAHGNSCA